MPPIGAGSRCPTRRPPERPCAHFLARFTDDVLPDLQRQPTGPHPLRAIPPKRPYEITQHGLTRIDNYYWMRDKNDPETMKHLRAESDYLEEIMQHTKPLQERLFSEMKARIKEDDSTVPEKRGGYFYYERDEQ